MRLALWPRLWSGKGCASVSNLSLCFVYVSVLPGLCDLGVEMSCKKLQLSLLAVWPICLMPFRWLLCPGCRAVSPNNLKNTISLAGWMFHSAMCSCFLQLPSDFSRLDSANHFILSKYWAGNTDGFKGEDYLKLYLKSNPSFNRFM